MLVYNKVQWSVTLRAEYSLRVSENRVLRIFGHIREEDGSWRKLHNDEIHSLCSSTNTVRLMKSRRMRWAEHVARMGEGRAVYGVLIGRAEGRVHWEDIGVGGRITLRWTLGI
jgi:hypothetical protein